MERRTGQELQLPKHMSLHLGLSPIIFSSLKIPWRGTHRMRPSQKGDMHEWTSIHEIRARSAWIQRAGFCNLNSKASPTGFTGVFIQWVMGQAGSQEWDQNCYTTFFYQIWIYTQKNCSCHACFPFLLSSIILQISGGRGRIYCCFHVLIHWVEMNQMRTVWDAL